MYYTARYEYTDRNYSINTVCILYGIAVLAPHSLMMTYRLILLSARSILLDSTFKLLCKIILYYLSSLGKTHVLGNISSFFVETQRINKQKIIVFHVPGVESF